MELVALVLFLSVILAVVMAPTEAPTAKALVLRSDGLALGEPALAD